MSNTDQIAAEAAEEFAKGLPFGLYLQDKATLIGIIKAAIENAYQLGWNKGWSKRNEVASKISDEIKEQLPKGKEEQPFSWIDNPPPSPRQ